MSIKNDLSREYIKNNEVFSDIINYYIFNGEEIIKPNDLHDLDTVYSKEIRNASINKIRDIVKRVCIKETKNNYYSIIGIENQSSIDKYMVIRNYLYDALEYDRQKSKKDDKIEMKIKPVITIVIYYGLRKWNAPRSLHELLRIDDNNPFKEEIDNYKLRLISLNELKLDDVLKFRSRFRQFSAYMSVANKKEEFYKYSNDIRFKNIDKETAHMLDTFVNINLDINYDEEVVDMCKAIREIRKDGILIGREEGAINKEREIIITMSNNGFDDNTISKALSLDIKYVKEVLNN